jgi:hypothetical protein
LLWVGGEHLFDSLGALVSEEVGGDIVLLWDQVHWFGCSSFLYLGNAVHFEAENGYSLLVFEDEKDEFRVSEGVLLESELRIFCNDKMLRSLSELCSQFVVVNIN